MLQLSRTYNSLQKKTSVSCQIAVIKQIINVILFFCVSFYCCGFLLALNKHKEFKIMSEMEVVEGSNDCSNDLCEL